MLRSGGAQSNRAHLPSQQVMERGSCAAIWHVRHLDARHQLEELARGVVRLLSPKTLTKWHATESGGKRSHNRRTFVAILAGAVWRQR
jgi:hypothetical protein